MGKKSQDRNWDRVLKPMCLIFTLVFIILFILNDKVLIFCLPIIYILIGCGNSAYEMFDNIAIYEDSKDDYKTSYVTFERFIEGIVTAFLTIISYCVFPEKNNTIKITFLISSFVYAIFYCYVRFKNRNFNK